GGPGRVQAGQPAGGRGGAVRRLGGVRDLLRTGDGLAHRRHHRPPPQEPSRGLRAHGRSPQLPHGNGAGSDQVGAGRRLRSADAELGTSASDPRRRRQCHGPVQGSDAGPPPRLRARSGFLIPSPHSCPRSLDQIRPRYSCQERSTLLRPPELGKKAPGSAPALMVVKPVGEGRGSRPCLRKRATARGRWLAEVTRMKGSVPTVAPMKRASSAVSKVRCSRTRSSREKPRATAAPAISWAWVTPPLPNPPE